MDGWTIYWILKLDILVNLCVTTCVFSFMGIVTSIGAFLYWKPKKPYYRNEVTEDGNPTEQFTSIKSSILNISKKCLVGCIILFFISFPFAVFMPTTKQACVIYVLPKIADNKHVQEIPNNISKLVNEKLVEWIDDIRGVKETVNLK